jgi:hypothetical protein
MIPQNVPHYYKNGGTGVCHSMWDAKGDRAFLCTGSGTAGDCWTIKGATTESGDEPATHRICEVDSAISSFFTDTLAELKTCTCESIFETCTQITHIVPHADEMPQSEVGINPTNLTGLSFRIGACERNQAALAGTIVGMFVVFFGAVGWWYWKRAKIHRTEVVHIKPYATIRPRPEDIEPPATNHYKNKLKRKIARNVVLFTAFCITIAYSIPDAQTPEGCLNDSQCHENQMCVNHVCVCVATYTFCPRPGCWNRLDKTIPYEGNCLLKDNPRDRGSLQTIYANNGGDSWLNTTNWNSKWQSMCTWNGVGCTYYNSTTPGINTVMSRVGSLNLRGQLVPGELHSSIGNLDQITCLDLGRNIVTKLPSTITNLKLLKSCGVDVNGNSLTGLRLDSNDMDTSSLEILCQMDSLPKLDLSRNPGLTTLPACMGTAKFTHIELSGNSVTSLDPVCTSTELTHIIAPNNELTSITCLPQNIQRVDVGGNKLTTVMELDSMANLTHVNIAANSLAVKIPKLPVTLINLTASQNRFTADISVQYAQLLAGQTVQPNLVWLDLSENLITGPWNDDIKQFTQLNHLYLQHNQMSGALNIITKTDIWTNVTLAHLGWALRYTTVTTTTAAGTTVVTNELNTTDTTNLTSATVHDHNHRLCGMKFMNASTCNLGQNLFTLSSCNGTVAPACGNSTYSLDKCFTTGCERYGDALCRMKGDIQTQAECSLWSAHLCKHSCPSLTHAEDYEFTRRKPGINHHWDSDPGFLGWGPTASDPIA